ncbi:MAG: hypothetical protein K6A40_13925 [Solobacterium sp.]|nr:hypothetical protein [Solobacterium sp.]
MKEYINNNGLQEMLTQAIDQMKADYGEKFDIEHVNLAELGRRTKLPRHVLRRLKKNGFVVKPHGNTGVVDDLLKKRVTNSEVIYDRIKELGYAGEKRDKRSCSPLPA